MSSTKNTNVYIDGFNLYFGLVEQGWRKYLWLDLEKLSSAILRSDQRLHRVKYFTSRISGPTDKQKRQNAYLTAIKTLPSVDIIQGRYQSELITCHDCRTEMRCSKCGRPRHDSNEKMTDVNIATHMFTDAHGKEVDELILITGDADQKPAVERVKKLFGKPVYVCFPPKR